MSAGILGKLNRIYTAATVITERHQDRSGQFVGEGLDIKVDILRIACLDPSLNQERL
jgi:hypothetical protein